MTQSWKSWNWKLWLLGLLVAAGITATSGYRTLAQSTMTVQSPTDFSSTVQAASLLIDTRGRPGFEKPFYKLDFTSLNPQSTANNPSPDQIYLQINGQIATPESTMNPGVKAGDPVQLNSGCLFDSSLTLEINRKTNDGKNEKIPKIVNSCNLFPSSSSLEFPSKNTPARYILNYKCTIVYN